MNRSATPASPHPAERRTYVVPVLHALGDIRDLTLGGSPGLNDSGNEELQDIPGPT